MLCPTRNIASVTSKSVYEPGAPSVPNDSMSETAAVAVHSRVLPSTCEVPIPASATTASV